MFAKLNVQMYLSVLFTELLFLFVAHHTILFHYFLHHICVLDGIPGKLGVRLAKVVLSLITSNTLTHRLICSLQRY